MRQGLDHLNSLHAKWQMPSYTMLSKCTGCVSYKKLQKVKVHCEFQTNLNGRNYFFFVGMLAKLIMETLLVSRTSFHNAERRLSARSHEVSNPQDLGLDFFNRSQNLTGTPAATLPISVIRLMCYPISRLQDFTRFGGKTSYGLVNRDPEHGWVITSHNLLSLIARFMGPIWGGRAQVGPMLAPWTLLSGVLLCVGWIVRHQTISLQYFVL